MLTINANLLFTLSMSAVEYKFHIISHVVYGWLDGSQIKGKKD